MNESLALYFLYFPTFLFGPILNERGYNGIRRDYTVLRKRRTTQEEWGPLLGKMDDLEREVKGVRAYPSRIDETRIEDRPFTSEEKGDISSRINSLERDINRVW